MKQLIKKALKALGLYNVVRSFLIRKYRERVNFEWEGEKFKSKVVAVKDPEGKWDCEFEEPRFFNISI